MSEPTVTDLILKSLERIEGKVDSHGTQLASIATDVTNVKTTLDDHIEDDKKLAGRVNVVEHWKTDLKAKIATYAAVAAFVWGIVVAVGKEALAAVMRGGN